MSLEYIAYRTIPTLIAPLIRQIVSWLADDGSAKIASVERAQEDARYKKASLEYQRRKHEREVELAGITVSQKERELQLQQQEILDQRMLNELQRNLMRELQTQEIEFKLTEVQTAWDQDTWFSKLSRQETERILLDQEHRLLILLSPPDISKDAPDSFRNNLRGEMRNVGAFLGQYYPLHDNQRPVIFYSDYFRESIGDIDLRRLQQILTPIPTAVFYSDISDYEINLRIGFWGLHQNKEMGMFATQSWDWEAMKAELMKDGLDEKHSLRQIRQLFVMLNKLFSAFFADLYYLKIFPNYNPQLFGIADDLVKEGFVKEWIKPYIDILRNIKQQQQQAYEKKMIAERKLLEEENKKKALEAELQLDKWAESQSLTLTGHSGSSINSVAFSPDGKTIASGSSDRTIKLWNLDGKLLTTLTGHSDIVISVAFSPNGKTIASGSRDNTIKLWNLDGKLLTTLTGHSYSVISVASSPNGKTIASGSLDRTIKLWNLDGKLLTTLTGHSGSIDSVAFSPDGKTIASGSLDRTIKLWNLDGKLLTTLTGHSGSIDSVAFSPDGKTIASGSYDNTIKLWNLDGKLLTTLTGHSGSIDSVAFSPDGKTIASGSLDKTIKLWRLYGELLTTLTGHSDFVKSVAFSPDGKTIASGSRDKTIKLWS